MAKPRVNIRISTKLYAQLCEAADTPGVTKTAIVEDALRAWFDPEARSVLEERLLVRMDAYDQRQADMERDLAFTNETLAHYVYYWLTRSEPIPEGERDIAHALGRKRFEYFLGQVALKLGSDQRSPAEHQYAESLEVVEQP
ncbi:MAG TPA: hypothetical protein DF282_02025 [Hyphomonas sp.]|nr:hypothetical protein [Hyphomonas sp.]